MAYFETITLQDGISLFTGSITPISLSGASCSGTTLTTTGSPALTTGMTIYAQGAVGQFSLGTIVSGSVNTWTVSIGGTIAAQTMIAIILGAGSSINTTSYPLVVIQTTTTSTLSLNIEGSNDGTNWFQLFLSSPNEPSILDNISSSGLYSLKTSSLYIRYNLLEYNGNTAITLNIQGRSGSGLPGGADNLTLALDAKNVTPIYVSYQPGQSGVKQDAQNAFVLSDAPAPVVVNAQVGQITIIDTQGYQTLQLTTGTTFAASGGFQVSNDGITFALNQDALSSATGGTMTTAIVASTTYAFNCTARYVRIVPTTAGAFTYFLRNGVTGIVAQNLTAIGGTAVSAATAQLGINVVQWGAGAVVNGGLAGTVGVGGGTAITTAGTAPTVNPVPAGIIDTSGFGRRTLGDIGGRTFVTGYNVNTPVSTAASASTTAAQQTNAAFAVGALLNTFAGTAALNVQDTTQFEGQSIIEMLFQMLLELRIANQQRYEMPWLLNNGIINGMDPPENFRQDPTAFTLQS